MSKVLGLWADHDTSFALVEAGEVTLHEELERFARQKEVAGDPYDLYLDACRARQEDPRVDAVVHVYPSRLLARQPSFRRLLADVHQWQARLSVVGHHYAHAAHAYYSAPPPFANDCLVAVVDGGGYSRDAAPLDAVTCFSLWSGHGGQLRLIEELDVRESNIGSVWTRATRMVFGLSSGPPHGDQAGSIMAMAAYGDASRYASLFDRTLADDVSAASGGLGEDTCTRYWSSAARIAQSDEQSRFDLAASLQAATERDVRLRLDGALRNSDARCLAVGGGVALNSVLVGKLARWFPYLDGVYVPPVPYDGGLSLGAAQQLSGSSMSRRAEGLTPYLGRVHPSPTELRALVPEGCDIVPADENWLVSRLLEGAVVGVWHGRSESGRRALGNRSILADPRDPHMRSRINGQIKHRAWYRPFAPCILEEDAASYFVDRASYTMSHTVRGSDLARRQIPSAIHVDGTARPQMVSPQSHSWLYRVLTEWQRASGVPALLNTSLNDNEPICETVEDAISCFRRAKLDALFLPEHQLAMVERMGS